MASYNGKVNMEIGKFERQPPVRVYHRHAWEPDGDLRWGRVEVMRSSTPLHEDLWCGYDTRPNITMMVATHKRLILRLIARGSWVPIAVSGS